MGEFVRINWLNEVFCIIILLSSSTTTYSLICFPPFVLSLCKKISKNMLQTRTLGERGKICVYWEEAWSQKDYLWEISFRSFQIHIFHRSVRFIKIFCVKKIIKRKLSSEICNNKKRLKKCEIKFIQIGIRNCKIELNATFEWLRNQEGI